MNISGTSPVKTGKKKTVTFLASSKKFKVTGKSPSAPGLFKTTDDATSQPGNGGTFSIDNEESVSPMPDWSQLLPRSSSPALRTGCVDLGDDISGTTIGGASTDPSEREDKQEPKTSKSLTDLSSCEFSVRVRRASSQSSRAKLNPAVLKARCIRRRFNRLSGGDLFHLYTRRFMNTFQRRRPPGPYGNVFNMKPAAQPPGPYGNVFNMKLKPEAQTGETSDGSPVNSMTFPTPDRSLGTTTGDNAGTDTQEEVKQIQDIHDESCAITAKEVPTVFTTVDDEIQFRRVRF
ncbi:Hypp1564 [Branchiostoma lanceolatum]|uniref:Hypp1564 protein n=1 Tax=Branchiostoma lanceolatum TaxID=7740 RepID=A0A8J9ZIY0_BRALA|nr:Hypp1564 [Branchiostoma lanceolatum]